MNDNLWPWLLSVVGLIGLWLAGKRRALGWYVGLGAQLLWVAFALITGQLGFLLSAVGYGVVYARNAWRWSQPSESSPEALTPSYTAVQLYDLHVAPLFVQFDRDLDRFHGRLISAVHQQIGSAAITVIQDHRLAFDPIRCLGCSWKPEEFAPAYEVVDQHAEHLRRELFKAYADRKDPIRLCMP